MDNAPNYGFGCIIQKRSVFFYSDIVKKIFSFSFSESSVDLDDSGSSSVYAQNLDLHLQTTDNADDVSIAVQFHKFCKKKYKHYFFYKYNCF